MPVATVAHVRVIVPSKLTLDIIAKRAKVIPVLSDVGAYCWNFYNAASSESYLRNQISSPVVAIREIRGRCR